MYYTNAFLEGKAKDHWIFFSPLEKLSSLKKISFKKLVFMLTNKNPLRNRYEIPEFSQEIKNSQEFSPLPNQRKILKKSTLFGFLSSTILEFFWCFLEKKNPMGFFFLVNE